MPPRPPPWKYRMASACSPAPPTPRLAAAQARVTRPLCSTRITRFHRYYGAVRPCAPHRYSAPHSSCCLGVSLSWPSGVFSTQATVSAHRFPRSAQEPEQGSRHLHPGRRLGSKQVSPRLVPGQRLLPVSTSSIRFRHVVSGLSTFAFLALT